MRRKSASHRPSISIVGPGNLGTALAQTLSAADYKVESIAVRAGSKRARQSRLLAKRVKAQLVQAGKQPIPGDIVWITVPDDAISETARALAATGSWKGRTVFHSSGALTSDELASLQAEGARVASVHPMMTFVRGEAPNLQGVAFALEGDAAAVRTAKSIVQSLGGRPFVIRKENKVLYHVFGSFASPLVIALMAAMEEVAAAAGIGKKEARLLSAPLLRATLTNYLRQGPEQAFTGPIARGDVLTVRGHLEHLERLPVLKAVYVALAQVGIKRLPVRNRQLVVEALLRASGDKALLRASGDKAFQNQLRLRT